jgi:hypothetical protein
MRNNIHIYIICLTFFVIIAATKSERFVKDNVFHSSYPKLQVKVDSKFKYLGRLEYTIEQPSGDRLQMVTYDTKSFVFVDSSNFQMKKALYIQMRREQTKYAINLLGDIKLNIRSGFCDLGEREYQCYTRVIALTAEEPIAKYIYDNGYTLPECVLSRTYVRLDTTSGNHLIVISYSEDLSESGFDCQTWQDKDRLTDEHEQYIAQFDRNRKAAFNMLKKDFMEKHRSKTYQGGETMMEKQVPSREIH